MKKMIDAAGLRVDKTLYAFVADELVPGTDVDPAAFWAGLSDIVADLGPKNKELLAYRTSCRHASTNGMETIATVRWMQPLTGNF